METTTTGSLRLYSTVSAIVLCFALAPFVHGQSIQGGAGTLQTQYVCSGSQSASYNVDTGSLNGISGYYWVISGGSISGSNTGSGVSVNWTSGGSLTVQIFMNGQVQPSYSANLAVTILSAPTVTISGPSLTCSANSTGSFTSTVVNGIGTLSYQWYRNYPTAISGATSATLTNTPLSQGDQITLRVWSTGWCGSSPISSNVYTANITASVTPTASATPSLTTICSGTQITFTASSPYANASTTYAWTKSRVPGTIANGSTYAPTAHIDPNVSMYTYSPGDQVSVTISNLSGACLAPTTVVANVAAVTITQVPDALVTPSTQAICDGGSTSIAITNPNITSGTTFDWTVSSNSNITDEVGGSGTPIAKTLHLGVGVVTSQSVTYTVTPKTVACFGSPVTATVTVNPVPVINVSPLTQSICNGQATMAGITNSSNVSGTTFAWTVSSNANILNEAAGSGASILQTNLALTGTTSSQSITYTVTPTANGCVGSTVPATVTLKPVPVMTVTPSTQSLCYGQTTMTGITNGSNVTGVSTTFAWTVSSNANILNEAAGSGASILQTDLALTGTTAAQSITYTVTPTANGCVGSTVPATVTLKPVPVMTATPSTQLYCEGVATGITNNSNVTGVTTTYAWTASVNPNITDESGGSGSSIAQTLHLGPGVVTNQSVTYTVTPTANSCAGSPVTATVTVKPVPVMNVSLSTQSFCNGQATMAEVINNSNVSGTTFAWTVSSNANILNEAAGSGASILQTDLALTGTTAAQSITYTVTPTANSCAGATVPATVTLKPVPVMTVTPSTQSICNGQTMTGITNGSNVTGVTTTYAWTASPNASIDNEAGGSGASILQPTLGLLAGTTSAQSITYTVTPTAAGCIGSTVPATVTLKPVPVMTVSPSTQSICNGQATMTGITNGSNVTGVPTTYTWTASPNASIDNEAGGSGASISQPTLALSAGTTSAQSITYTVTPTAAGCIGSTVPATVTLKPVPVMTVTPSTQSICNGQTTMSGITNGSNVTGGVTTTYAWTASPNAFIDNEAGGSGASISQPTLALSAGTTSAQTITYTVTPTAASCIGSTVPATVTLKPVPVMTVTPSTQSICNGQSTMSGITNGSNVTGGVTTTYAWTASSNAFIDNEAGGSGASISQPTLALSAGTTSAQSITYTVTPTAAGCIGSTVPATVTLKPVPIMTVTPSTQSFCEGQTTMTGINNGSNVTGVTTTYAWSVSSNANILNEAAGSGASILQTDLALTGTTAAQSITYTVTPTANGCVGSTVPATVTLKPVPVMTVTPSTQSFCEGQTTMTGITNGSNVTGVTTTYAWAVSSNANILNEAAGSGASILQTNLALTGTTAAQSITYTVTPTANGCVGSTVPATVTLKPVPVMTVTPSTQSFCDGVGMTGIVNGSNVTGVATTYAWTASSNSSISNEANGTGASISQSLTLVGGTTSAQSVTYTVTPTANSCVGSPVPATVTLKPIPNAQVSSASQNVCSGQPMNSVTVTNPNNVVGTTLSWTVSAPSITGASSGSGASGALIAATLSQTTTSNKTATYTVTASANSCTSAPVTHTATVYAPLIPGAAGVPVTICTGSNPAVLTNTTSPSGGSGTYTYQWEQSANGLTGWSAASGTNNAATYDPPVLTSSKFYRRGVSCVTSVYTAVVQVTVSPLSAGGTVTTDSENYGVASGTLNLAGQTGIVQTWQAKVDSVWSDVAGTSTTFSYNNVTATTQYRAAVKSGVCAVAYSTTPATVTIYAIPQVTITGTTFLAPGGSVVFTATGGMFWYQWMKDNIDLSGQTASVLTITHPGTYKLKVKAASSNSPIYTTGDAVITYVFEHQMQDMNYVQTVNIQKAGVTPSTDLYDLQAKDFALSTTYFDGLGRPVQSVALGAGGNGSDLVQSNVYDKYGREPKKYLPYGESQRDGRYQPAALDHLTDFYESAIDVAHDTVPYSRTMFEASPLSRPLKDFGPGQAWSPSEGNKYVEHKYLINAHGTGTGQERIINWIVDATGNPIRDLTLNGGYHTDGSLSIKSTLDEQGNEVREYTNTSGQVILKKVYATGTITDLNNVNNWASTYYIYDDFNQLRFVFQPELSKVLGPSTTLNPDSTALADFSFQYKYDARKRMISKRVPGAAEVLMVYDKRDRLVLSQDGNLRAQNQWLFTKYDILNRPVMTGIYSHGSLLNRDGMDLLIDTSNFFETVNTGAIHGYTTAIFPSSNLNILTVTYYDNYTYVQGAWSGFTFIDEDLSEGGYNSPNTAWTRVMGQVTGTKVKVLDGGNTYLRSINYYDDHQRLIQVITDNYKGGWDRVSSLFDFAGKVLKTSLSHHIATATRVVTMRKTYDANNRPLGTYHKVGASEVLLSANEYNSIGQLKAKNLHGENGNFAQELDYEYNIRGWLSKINQPDVSHVAGNDEVIDYFGMELGYQSQLSGLTPDVMFNGNISAMKWAVLGKTDQSYEFEYDPMNRLLEATHFDRVAINQWDDNDGRFSEGGLVYDLNGNIKHLKRKDIATTYMDDLSYTYSGNRLLYVGDGGDPLKGFINGNSGTDDYDYDVNGNLSKDMNKGIGAGNIRYNFLNLPRSVRKSGADSLVYMYDATGRKLRQQVYGTKSKITDYAGPFIYENDTLRFINHEEGRVLPDGSDWEYQYHLKDHLGNVRLTFTSKDTEEKLATLETANMTAEVADFLRYENARRIYSIHFDRTNGSSPGYAQRLNGSANEKYGLARSLSVMPGDTVRAEVYAKYVDLSESFSGAFATLMTQIANLAGGVVVDGGLISSSGSSFPAGFAGLSGATNSGGAPKAYLNWLVFDRDFNFITGGYKPMTTAAKESGQDVAHERLSTDGHPIVITEPGYVYIYLSNEDQTTKEVYFDDMKVEHMKPVVQMDNYYPFGLTFSSFQREASTKNPHLFNGGAEREDELDLKIDVTKYRVSDPAIARWWQVDPKPDTDGQEAWSVYNYGFNNPIRYNDPNGDCIPCLLDQFAMKWGGIIKNMNSAPSTGALTRSATNTSQTLQHKTKSDEPATLADTKGMARIADAKSTADVTAKNTKTVVNEAGKDAVTVAKAAGTAMELTGVGAPAGLVINTLANGADESRQFAFEAKPGLDATQDFLVTTGIDLTFAGMGQGAKTAVKEGEVGKNLYDKVIDMYSNGLTAVTQWASGVIKSAQSEKKKK